MADVDVWGVFGLEAPAEPEEPQELKPAGEQEQELADPADVGEQEQEPADPADDEDDGEDGQEQPAEKKPLTKEERRANAAQRRKQEIDAAVQAALEKERSENNARVGRVFAQMRLKNQHQGGADIDSLEKAEQWAEQDRLAKLQQNLKTGKLTAEDLQTAMEQSPAFKALQERQTASEQAETVRTQKEFSRNVELELAEIQKLNPGIKSLTDILQMETGGEFARLVQKNGMRYLDAYKLANYEDLMSQAKTVAAAGAKLAGSGKEHLTRTETRGQGKLEVPKDVKDSYRLLDPTITDAEIEKHYRKTMGT